MTAIFISLFLGILVGYFKWTPESWGKYTHKFIIASMIVMLIALGAQVGSDPEVLGKITQLGAQSLGITLLAMLGSALALWCMNKVWPIQIQQEDDSL